MIHRPLGNSGLGTSVYGLGTATFGEGTNESEAMQIMDAFADCGGLLIDTADAYADGRAETIVGRWLSQCSPSVRDGILLSTKGGGYTTSATLNGWGNSRHNLRRSLEMSLRRLGVDNVTLYQMHTWDPQTPLEETLAFLDEAVRSGKVEYVGLSNFTGWQIQRAVDIARHSGLIAPVVHHCQYNLLCREVEWEILPACRANELGLLAWSPLSGGLLTNKYADGSRGGTHARFADKTERGPMHDNYTEALFTAHVATDRTANVLGLLAKIADGHSATPAAVALAWVAAMPGISGVLLGARTANQLKSNLQAITITLASDEIESLTAASAPSADGYPYGPFGTMQRSRSID